MASGEQQAERPRIVLLGRTGAGKSSLINALMGAEVQRVEVVPTTKEPTRLAWETLGEKVVLIDSPGVEDCRPDGPRTEAVFDLVAEAHVLLWVIGYPSRDLQKDAILLREIHRVDPLVPILILGTALDRVHRDFDPEKFNPDKPTNDHERAANDWITFLKGHLDEVGGRQVVACAAGESADDTGHQYNLRGIHDALAKVLPDQAKLDFIRRSRALGPRNVKAQAIIAAAAVAAGAIAAANPIPVADAILITPVQAAMVVALTVLYGQPITLKTAGGLVAAGLAGVTGPIIVQQLLKFIPLAGPILGATAAALMTAAIGEAVLALLKSGTPLTPEAIKEASKEAYRKLRKKKD